MSEPTYECITVTTPAQHVAMVTLNRPDAANALSPDLLAELHRAVRRIDRDPDTHVWILTGAPRSDGRPWFSAGADLKAFSKGGPFPVDGDEVTNFIDDLLTPSIAAIDGLCTTGALELALACDIRIASRTAELCDWHLRHLGAGIGGWGMAARLARLVGPDKAKELLLTGRSVDGDEAARIGLVNRAVESEQLFDEALEMATTIASRRPDGVRLTMGFLSVQADMSKYEALHWAQQVSGVMGISSRFPDLTERTEQRFAKDR